jgi:heme/copper-type cytochrome/quinol oxidase subunit 1
VMIALGLLVFVANALMTWGLARRTPDQDRPADPYEASTLEWATSSPPPEDDFDVIPDVRSDAPLADWRQAESSRP